MKHDEVAQAIRATLESPNVADANLESANVVDVIDGLRKAVNGLGGAICPVNWTSVNPGRDACGGHVESLTEAVMGITSGLVRIAEALSEVASAIQGRSTDDAAD